jgi:hypothetical protein
MGSMVLFLRISIHEDSLGERERASLIVGLSAGHATDAGAYPPDGEFGSARLTAASGAAMSSAATTSGEASRATTIDAI